MLDLPTQIIPFRFYTLSLQRARENSWPVCSLPPDFKTAKDMYEKEFRFLYIILQLTDRNFVEALVNDLRHSHLYVALSAWWSPPIDIKRDFLWYDTKLEVYTCGSAWEQPVAFYVATMDLFSPEDKLDLGEDYKRLEEREAIYYAKQLFPD
jgi:hypothetical protein